MPEVIIFKFKFKFKLFIGITSKATSFTNVQETKTWNRCQGISSRDVEYKQPSFFPNLSTVSRLPIIFNMFSHRKQNKCRDLANSRDTNFASLTLRSRIAPWKGQWLYKGRTLVCYYSRPNGYRKYLTIGLICHWSQGLSELLYIITILALSMQYIPWNMRLVRSVCVVCYRSTLPVISKDTSLSIAKQCTHSIRRHRIIVIWIPIINLRRSSDHLQFTMGIPIQVRRCLFSE